MGGILAQSASTKTEMVKGPCSNEGEERKCDGTWVDKLRHSWFLQRIGWLKEVDVNGLRSCWEDRPVVGNS